MAIITKRAAHPLETMTNLETKFLQLPSPRRWVLEMEDGWHVCWLGGWD